MSCAGWFCGGIEVEKMYKILSSFARFSSNKNVFVLNVAKNEIWKKNPGVMDLHTVLSPKILSNQLNILYTFSTLNAPQKQPTHNIFRHKLARNRSQIQC